MRAIAIQGLVRRLLILEAGEGQDQEALIAAAECVLDKLRGHLAHRVGQEGFRTLLARALFLAAVNFPSLRTVRVGTDGSIVGLRGAASADFKETPNNVAQQDASAGAAALVERLFELLVTFIGETLTLGIVHAVWFDLGLEDAAEREDESP